ncbi:UvrD-helicase domain-containing protein [Fusobacterium sp. THCT1E2]
MDLSITSNDEIKIDTHFKIVAGPGAGKTTFLINHIKNIFKNSNKISIYRKIACITYTNVAVENILNKLNSSVEMIEVTTIHGFLYKHILKPYLWILSDEYKFNFKEIKGHDEINLSYSLLQNWKERTKNFYLTDNTSLVKTLLKGNWKLNKDFSVQIIPNEIYNRKVKTKDGKSFSLKEKEFRDLKNICWEKGLISHDDVLYLSYEILKKSPRILDILRAKFPYILIDEFQDTNPFQTEIIKMLAEKESIIGVIGDDCQSIYGFQGADVSQFREFNLAGMQKYNILDNHRSTKEIVELLNHMRKEELCQVLPINNFGEKPKIIVGDLISNYSKVKNICLNEKLYVLSYKDSVTKSLEYNMTESSENDILDKLLFDDNNRGKRIWNLISAIEYAKQLNFKEVMKFMEKIYKNSEIDKGKMIKILKLFIDNYDTLKDLKITEFYNDYVMPYCNFKQKITSGKVKDIYDETPFNKIASLIKINEDKSNFRTIHKTKGEEVDNVLILLETDDFNEKKSLNFLLKPDMQNEEHRVYYVALSRAKKRIFISIPRINKELKNKFKQIPFIELQI